MSDWNQEPRTLSEKSREWLKRQWAAFKRWYDRQPRWRIALIGIGVPFLMGMLFVMLLALLVWQGAFGALPDYAQLKDIRNYQASEIYADDGALLGKYYIENRTNASMEEISPEVIQALVATEDARFFEHSGIDLRAFGRVLFKSILLSDESAGGGSTLSQQLAKNLFPRRSYALLSMPINKLREMFIARRLENLYSKEDLLNLYLNTVPFGENAFGIKVAAYRFFNKQAEALAPQEAALLVGMLKGTSYYNPRHYPERAQERRNLVLRQMMRFGHLDTIMVDSLLPLPVELDFREEGHNEGLATYFREHLRQQVLDILEEHTKPDGSAYNLYTDGLRIYTSIDSRLQAHAEAAIARQMPRVQTRFKEDWKNRQPWRDRTVEQRIRQSKRYQGLTDRGLNDEAILANFQEPVPMTVFDWQGGAVDTLMSPMDSIKHYLTLLNVGFLAADPVGGLIKAWVGGIDHRFIQYDHVKSHRPIGSTIKPVVYAAALQSGMLPCEYTENIQKTYEQFDNWSPQNSDGEYGGAYSMAGALSKSVNTIAVELTLRAGVENLRALARDMGIESELPKGPAIALGAVDASLWEMIRVYSTLANRGYRPTKLHYLDRIETSEGEVIVSFDRPNYNRFTKVLEPGHADMMLNLMQSVVDSGTAKRMRTEFGVSGPLFAKTGTTQDQRDGWFIAFNPSLVAGAWVGAEDPDIHFRTLYRGQGSRTALPVVGQFLRDVYRDRDFRAIRRATYPTPPDTIYALLQCPPYLPELPIMDFGEDSYEEVVFWSRTIDRIHPELLAEVLRDKPRRNNENLIDYAERILRISERRMRQYERRSERREFWGRVLFGEEEDDDDG